MKDKGLNRGLVQDFNTSDRNSKGAFYGFRKMFWTYLKKLGVAFYDPCCEDAMESDRYPVAYDASQGEFVRFDGTSWVAVTSFSTTTTTTAATTTTTSSTTTTTTAP